MAGWHGICFFFFLGPILRNDQISAFNFLLYFVRNRRRLLDTVLIPTPCSIGGNTNTIITILGTTKGLGKC